MSPNDRPDAATIADDSKLDRWFDQFMRDLARKSGRQGQRHGGDRERAQAMQVFTPEEVQSHQR